MGKLHTFGCSITQGFALPDVVNTIRDEDGRALTEDEIRAQGILWSDIHVYAPSKYAWPQILADRLGTTVTNHARRGSCFQQIARQIAVAAQTIRPEDTVIVMWTYLSRISLQWPRRTAVPFCTVTDNTWGWQSIVLGFNKFFGLEQRPNTDSSEEETIMKFIKDYAELETDPMAEYDRYYNNMVLQMITDQALKNTGARVIHLSVEAEPVQSQLERSRRQLYASLGDSYTIPDPRTWYDLDVDYGCAPILLDPRIPLAENDMHPSVRHHSNFAEYLETRYFSKAS